ncbi:MULTISPECIES: DUF4279 domain-containing protein [Exiguobacterium]|uniref:DUF4279 domain-containing protein n=1 Tax=Exiguobacterium TaxID=33986 RepID=UPI001BEAA476|nr:MULTISPECIES: DUF4279 domain-containing protein [Exiguobacterium]MCT4777776.1 DUF4279 domain-containing protein [Exiguobacterium aquaticum]MCT4790380.1 DUF4279 domain-containing protein [Exiguobacterium mexicanum]
MNPAQTEVLVYFQLLADDFSIEDVSHRLGLTPTETFERGDKSTYSSRPREYTSWSLGTGYQPSFDVNDQLQHIIAQLRGKETILDDIYNAYDDIRAKFTIVIVMENGQTPSLVFDLKTIQFVDRIRAEFDIDLYANPYEEDHS